MVLTEDSWNAAMGDSVAVPLYDKAGRTPSKLVVPVGTDHVAPCTRVQSIPHEYFGPPVGRSTNEEWTRIRAGVRAFLDIDRRITEASRSMPERPREDWWPGQHDVHFAESSRIGRQDKLYAVVADNEWNAAPRTRYTAAVRLTSRTKERRRRWEVPVSGGWVVAGDLYSISYARFEQSPPSRRYPRRLTDREGAEIALRQKVSLTLR